MKNEYRRFFKNLRREMSEEKIKAASAAIYEKLIASDFYKEASTIFTYLSIDKEVDTRKIIAKALADKKKVYIPHIDGDSMKAVRLNGLDDIIEGKYGIPTTRSDETITNPDLSLVPGLSFDRNKTRLGYGGGYYDKFLDTNKTLKIGLFLSEFETTNLPKEPWDVAFDYIITDKEII